MNIPVGGTITPNSMTLVVDGITNVLTPASHPHYDAIRKAWKLKDVDQIRTLLDLTSSVRGIMDGRVTVEHGVVRLDGDPLHNVITDRILEQHVEGFDASATCNFLVNLDDNPSKVAVDELYLFLEAAKLPFTDDGYILAYKMVRDDYTDHYTGKIDNSIGAVPEMKRNKVDDRRDVTCSFGLHFCSQNYLNKYASNGRVIVIKINPRDVVSIPSDYNNAKGRCCKYEVVGEIDKKFATVDHSFGTSVMTAAQVPGSVLRDATVRPVDGQFIAKRVIAEWFEWTKCDLLYELRMSHLIETAQVSGKMVVVWRDRYIEEYNPLFPEGVKETSSVSDSVLRDATVRPVDGQFIAKRVFGDWLGAWDYTDLKNFITNRPNKIETATVGGKMVVVWRDRYVDEFGICVPEAASTVHPQVAVGRASTRFGSTGTGKSGTVSSPSKESYRPYDVDMDDLGDGDYIPKTTFARFFPNYENNVRELIRFNDIESTIMPSGKTVIIWRNWYKEEYGY